MGTELGVHLVKAGKLAAEARDRAEQVARESGERFEHVLPRLGLIGERELTEALAEFLKLPVAKVDDYPANPVLADRVNPRFLSEAKIIPLEDRAHTVAVACVNPLNTYTLDAARFAMGKPLTCYVAYPSDFEAAYVRLYGGGKTEITQIFDEVKNLPDLSIVDDTDRLKDSTSDAPVIRLVNLLITKAVEARASDIHIEPMEDSLRVRYRIDGVLHVVEALPARLSAAIVSRIKIMAKLNIAERRLAQDGRIGLAVRGRDVDFRVSTLPAVHGESVVLRILDREHLDLNFLALGFDDHTVAQFRNLIVQPHGILLVTGPTGSGKTTTLYAGLLELNTPEKKILTIEDPVEYQLPGINQVQVKPQIGLTFASALRSFLRQDPDIMMIGEIRDLETAQIAVQAALTGHLILSTLHTNDAASAVTRLRDMGVEDYLLTSTVNGVAAQRLVRTLCPGCREAYVPLPEAAARLGLSGSDIVLYRAKGCETCNHTGYRGRSSIVEVLAVSDAVRHAILKSADASALQEIARAEGMQTMYQHGLQKAQAGLTSVDEVIRVTRSV